MLCKALGVLKGFEKPLGALRDFMKPQYRRGFEKSPGASSGYVKVPDMEGALQNPYTGSRSTLKSHVC